MQSPYAQQREFFVVFARLHSYTDLPATSSDQSHHSPLTQPTNHRPDATTMDHPQLIHNTPSTHLLPTRHPTTLPLQIVHRRHPHQPSHNIHAPFYSRFWKDCSYCTLEELWQDFSIRLSKPEFEEKTARHSNFKLHSSCFQCCIQWTFTNKQGQQYWKPEVFRLKGNMSTSEWWKLLGIRSLSLSKITWTFVPVISTMVPSEAFSKIELARETKQRAPTLGWSICGAKSMHNHSNTFGTSSSGNVNPIISEY